MFLIARSITHEIREIDAKDIPYGSHLYMAIGTITFFTTWALITDDTCLCMINGLISLVDRMVSNSYLAQSPSNRN